jgi:hypothetical protein
MKKVGKWQQNGFKTKNELQIKKIIELASLSRKYILKILSKFEPMLYMVRLSRWL